MRSRSLLFLLVLLLATASLAIAAEPIGPMTPAPERASAAANPACNPILAKLGISLAPASHNKDTLICGQCSVTACRGVGYGSICSGGTNVKTCISAYGNDCADGTPQCQCWSGPLP
jgi:hypothetical protein